MMKTVSVGLFWDTGWLSEVSDPTNRFVKNLNIDSCSVTKRRLSVQKNLMVKPRKYVQNPAHSLSKWVSGWAK